MLLYYIRHGKPTYTPNELTPLGKRQAEAIAKRIAMHGVDKIISSPSNRAYQTAIPLSEMTKKEICPMEFLNETFAWKYFAIPRTDGGATWVYQIPEMLRLFAGNEMARLGYEWYEHPRLKDYHFREGIQFFDNNADELLKSLGYAHNRETHTYMALRENHERVAVFAHEGIGSAFLSSILDIPYPLFAAHYAMSFTGMTVIHFDSCGEQILPQLWHYSDDSHIYKEGLPTNYCNGTAT